MNLDYSKTILSKINDMNFTHIDAHTHIQFKPFAHDRDEVIRRARDAGIAIVNVGSDLKNSEDAVRLAEQFDSGMYAVVGIHPTDAEESFDVSALTSLAHHEKVVAIGECGLDYFHVKDEAKKAIQKNVFIEHIKISHAVGKPLMIHCRDAMRDLIDILNTHKELIRKDSVMHFFSGTEEEAKELLALGFSFTFGGVITFVRDYDDVVRSIPLDRILSETDAPYVTPVPHRGTRNEPSYVIEVEKRIAELKETAEEDMAKQIVKNAERIFSIRLS